MQRFLRSTILLAAVLSIFAIVFNSCKEAPNAPQNSQDLSGFARDEQGYNVPNAIIQILNASGSVVATDTTDENGFFSVSKLGSATGLSIRIVRNDFKTFTAPVSSYAGSTSAQIMMTHSDSACGHLKLTITDNSTQSPISGAEVRLSKNGNLVTLVYSDATGIVAFNHLSAGTYSVRIAKTGYQVVERSVSVQYCDSTSLDIRMEATHSGTDSCCHGQLRITPIDTLGHVIINSQVQLSKTGMDTKTLIAGQSGVLFSELCAGTYGVRISRDGFKVLEFSITMGCNDVQEGHKTLYSNAVSQDSCCRGVLHIIPRDSATTQVLVGATVRINHINNTDYRTLTSASNGVEFHELCQGTFAVRISIDHYRAIEYNIELGCNQTREDNRHLAPIVSADSCCHGRLRIIPLDDATNAYISGATVRITLPNQSSQSGVSGSSGGVLFDGLCMGTYPVRISKDGYQAKEFNVELGCNEAREISAGITHNAADSCCTAVISSRVKDSTYAEAGWLNDVHVIIRIAGHNDIVAEGYTNVDGIFNAEHLCAPATYAVTYEKQGFQHKTVNFQFTTCTTKSETIRLAP